MITDQQTIIACRCPECGSIIRRIINIFDLSGTSLDIPCPNCEASKLTLSLSRDGKVRLLVPCLACPSPHPYTLGSTVFFERDIFLLQCSFSGLDICFIGKDENKINEALEQSDAVIAQLLEESDTDDQNAASKHTLNRSPFANDVVMHNVLCAIETLAENNAIHCLCQEKGETPAIAVDIDYDRLHITCKNCHCRTTLDAATNADSNNAIDMESLYLD